MSRRGRTSTAHTTRAMEARMYTCAGRGCRSGPARDAPSRPSTAGTTAISRDSMVRGRSRARFAVREHVDHEDVGDAVGGDERPAGQQHGAPVLGEHLDERQLGRGLRVTGLLELLALGQPEPDPHRDGDQQALSRNGTRQPQARNASSSAAERGSRKQTLATSTPAGTPICGGAAVEAAPARAGRARWPRAPRRPTRRRRRGPG